MIGDYKHIYRVGCIYYFVRHGGGLDISCTHVGFGKGICIDCIKQNLVTLNNEREIIEMVKKTDGEKIK